LQQHQNHSKVFYNFADNLSPEKLPFEKVKKILGQTNFSDKDIAMIIDELYNFSIITYKMFNEKEG
jgi:hypothetical protein